MLEKYLSRILTSKFENVVEDFDEKALNISAWKGEVSLENLILKRTALDTFNDDVPVDVVYGSIGKLELRIPWSSLGTKSSSIILTDVSLVIAPREVDESADKQKRLNKRKKKKSLSKEERIQALLNPRILHHSIAASHKRNRLARFLSWVSSSLFSNLSVTIRNIHVRYEDPGTSLGFVWTNHVSPTAFAVGLNLQQFSVQTTYINDQDNDKSVKKYKVTRKLAAAHQLAVYWDHDSPLIAMVVRQEKDTAIAREYAAVALLAMEDPHAPVTSRIAQQFRRRHSYVLLPISPSLQFSLVVPDASARNANLPPSTVIMSLPPCHLEVSRTVLENLAYIRKSFAYWKQSKISEEFDETHEQLKRIRPTVPCIHNAESWWQYAIEATIILGRRHAERRRRRGWGALAHAIVERRQYVDLYRQLVFDDDIENIHRILGNMEENLDADEIASFRLVAYESMLDLALPVGKPESKNADADDVVMEIASGKLSVKGRKSMTVDAIRMLKEGRKVASKDDNVAEVLTSGEIEAAIQWKTSLFCPELSLQVNARNLRNALKPIARLSFACVQRQSLRRDGSWELDATVAAFKLIDMGERGSVFPTLIGAKGSLVLNDREDSDDYVVVSGQRFRQCMHVQVQRKFTQYQDGIGSSTHSILRLQPLEVVFSANVVERLTNLFSPIRTPELVGDFERMSFVVSQWRERQRQRLIQALAHRRKRISVDLDMVAPVIMIPEALNRGDETGEMLVIDLGRLQLRNIEHDDSFNDVWKLHLSLMQLQNFRFLSPRDPSKRVLNQQIIEPFSLEFKISTNIVLRQKREDAPSSTCVVIDASLPRMVFNLKTSSIRLMSRLFKQRASLKQKSAAFSPTTLESNFHPCTHQDMRRVDEGSHQKVRPSRVFKFIFAAPIIAVKLNNDVDGRCCAETCASSTPIVNLAFRGIRGTFTQLVSANGSASTDFVAKMKALEAVDLYQEAGRSFALLLSSVRPSAMPDIALDKLIEQPEERIHSHIKTDLVSVTYEMRTSPSSIDLETGQRKKNSISIKFHELFVEWNPETIAAIHKATRAEPFEEALGYCSENADVFSNAGADRDSDCGSDDEFFDTFEDRAESFCSASEMNDDDGSYLVSEIASSQSSLQSGKGTLEGQLLNSPTVEAPTLTPSWITNSPRMSWAKAPLTPALAMPLSPMRPTIAHRFDKEETRVVATLHGPFVLSFDLSTLQVSFNKETRRRRLIVAEMASTSVRFSTRVEGGSRTVANIGNLVFTDPSCSDGTTLYHQILGLKTDGVTMQKEESSLLELEFITNPSERKFESSFNSHLFSNNDADDGLNKHHDGVTINPNTGEIRGCNNYVNISFSPMRFVYLQQLWFEIIDYFFEGITGYEVWGNVRPLQEPALEMFVQRDINENEDDVRRTPDLPGSRAEGIGFTCFKISLLSPEVLLPIQYNSPHFIRFSAQSLEVSNLYTSRVHKVRGEGAVSRECVQWFNNCSTHFHCIKVQSWRGTNLTLGRDGASENSDIRLKMIWPTGPTRQMVAPKWRVSCILDEIDLSLRSEDYALFQHVILYNIGEPSRHLDEWIRFQEMPITELEAYKEKIMVHYGYDKKDADPSTYDVEVVAPLLLINLMGQTHEQVIAQAMFLNLTWKMQRFRDMVSQQRLVSNVVLVKPLPGGGMKSSLSLLLPTKRGTARDNRPDVVYTSATKTSGENVKTIQIFDAGINLSYPAWIDAIAFFSNLDKPQLMTQSEVLNSVQIGDRWYSISSHKEKGRMGDNATVDRWAGRSAYHNSNAILQTFHFRILLESPRIVLESENDGSSVILHMNHLDSLQISDVVSQSSTRTIFIHDLELYTVTSTSYQRDAYSVENSLIRPWSFIGQIVTRDDVEPPDRSSHSVEIATEVLKARAAYSDMIVALDVAHQLVKDIKIQQGLKQKKTANLSQTHVVPDDPSRNVQERSMLFLDCAVHVDGVEILVVDDSMRHFATSQELVSLSLGTIVLRFEEIADIHSMKFDCGIKFPIDTSCPGTFLTVRVSKIDLIDYLQATTSRFRIAATSQASTNELQSNEGNTDRILEWHLYSTLGSVSAGFEASTHLIRLLQSRCTDLSLKSYEWSVVYENIQFQGLARKITIEAQSFLIQWNPSTVIALQRFLGRLMKEMQLKSHAKDMTLKPTPPHHVSSDVKEGSSRKKVELPMDMVFTMNSLSVCLNKEHQNRRLLMATLTSISVTMAIDVSANSTFIGRVNDVHAFDEDTLTSRVIFEENRSILKVVRKSDGRSRDQDFPFLTFQYSTYSESHDASVDDIPSWIAEKLKSGSNFQGIDDYLSISIASVQLTYIRGRTEELADYLTNGLPGKGMGLTSSAAKGFINKRIQTRSFLSLTIAAPLLRIPEHEESLSGVVLHLGDMQLRTWFELESAPDDRSGQNWCRALAASVLGLAWTTYGNPKVPPDNDLPIDLHFDLRKPTNITKAMDVRGRLSFVVMNLRYSDYLLLRNIIACNVGRKADVLQWDNVEKAYWKETMEERERSDQSLTEQHVEYSSSARFVRYGPKERLTGVNKSESEGLESKNDANVVNFGFKMDGVRLTLHRDDDIDADIASGSVYSAEFHYDIVLLKLDRVNISFSLASDGDTSLNVALSRISMYDLGDFGRIAREHYYRKLATMESRNGNSSSPSVTLRSPSAFSVIAEGYQTTEGDETVIDSIHAAEQLVLTVDTCPSSAVGTEALPEFESERATVVRIVINYLSINAMMRPLSEVMSFATCSWTPSADASASTPSASDGLSTSTGKINAIHEHARSSSCFQLKLVAHYPRVFFVADESDPNSRALVLRGLAVVNTSFFTESLRSTGALSTDVTRILALEANLQSMESFINPDVSAALGKNPDRSTVNSTSDLCALGVALIQPVTAGIEFKQTSRERFPTIRSLNLNMESMSTMISFEDLGLISQVVRRWSPENRLREFQVEGKVDSNHDKTLEFEEVFHTRRLGLMLKKGIDGVVVDRVEANSGRIKEGDRLLFIDQTDIAEHSLNQTVKLLSERSRPMILRFSRTPIANTFQDDTVEIDCEDSKTSVHAEANRTIGLIDKAHKWYQLHFKTGMPSGIVVQRSQFGDIPIISSVNLTVMATALVGDNEATQECSSLLPRVDLTRVPLSGTAVIAVSTIKAVDIGFDEISRLLDELAKTNTGDYGEYTISFLELSSDEWGSIDSFDSCITGVALTFIDDFQGRDMPLLRGKLDLVELHCDRGLGLLTEKIDTSTASVFGTIASAIERTLTTETLEELSIAIRNIQKEQVVKISGSYQSEMDYFHPRIAVWEPFLEPSQLAMSLVWKPGIYIVSQKRPGQLAFEISDRLDSVTQQRLARQLVANHAVSLNVTDAAAEVVARTLRQFKKWKESLTQDRYIEDYDPAPLAGQMHSNATFDSDLVGMSENTAQGYPDESIHVSVKRAAGKEAAQAALLFAQKRGANTQMKGDSAKPFLFRNETGIDVSFCVIRKFRKDSPDNVKKERVASGCEHRFQLEVLAHDDAKTAGDSEIRTGKKVRSYDGRFPPVGVWIDSSDDLKVEPLLDLHVSRVGTFVRELKISHRKDSCHDDTLFCIPLIWRVELDDNRRILTISSAVQISSLAIGLSLDLGFTCQNKTIGASPMEFLCTINPGETFFLPVWMSLGVDECHIYFRPSTSNSSAGATRSFGWGHASALKYECHTPHWMFDEPVCSIACSKPCESHPTANTIFLNCLNAPFAVDGIKGDSLRRLSEKKRCGSREILGVINVVVDSGVSLRNMLPIPVDWEIADTTGCVIDRLRVSSDDGQKSYLESGARAEVFACDLRRSALMLRLRPMPAIEWPEWTTVSLPMERLKSADVEEPPLENFEPLVQHLSAHTLDDFGVPIRFGIRATPKLHHSSRGRSRFYGLELVVFAELWFQNLTDLPLSFGCPWSQLNTNSTAKISNDTSTFESASKAAAESALLEIASVLEFGEKGKGLRAEERTVEGFNFFNIPLQASFQQTYELFEYMEVNGSLVNRHWWAGEQYDNQRRDLVDVPEKGTHWTWLDDCWHLDWSGRVKKDDGAWESCRSLTAGRDSYFSGQRTFDGSHLFRRRRWFRKYDSDGESLGFRAGIHAFHHPIAVTTGLDNVRQRYDATHFFSLRNVDGEWSDVVQLPHSGPAAGFVRVMSSRWPSITGSIPSLPRTTGMSPQTSLKPEVYEVCYSVSDIPGEWGDFSRLVTVTPRFHLRNDSSTIFEVKQAGVLDSSAIRVYPGVIVPFYWQDFRLPFLVCVRPLSSADNYRWSGGFDISTLGAVPLRVRPKHFGGECKMVSVKALIEMHPNNSGIDVAIKDEDVEGVGAMFRIENNTPFPIWVAQDGVLANPSPMLDQISPEHNELRRRLLQSYNLSDRPPEIDGDIIFPCTRTFFALDVPFRQGKYANRKAATMQELLRVRIGLAPLSTRSGVETTKVVSFKSVGDTVRLNPTKLLLISSLMKQKMGSIRVLGIVVTDGPTRVLQFHLMRKESSTSQKIGKAIVTQYTSQPGNTSASSPTRSEGEEVLCHALTKATFECVEMKKSGKVPKEDDVRRAVFFSQQELELSPEGLENDIVFTFSGHFTGFLFSMIDAAPAEIATVAIRGLEAVAKWNMKRSGDAMALISVAWVQVDNHVPNAPYPVAVCPDQFERNEIPGEPSRTPLIMLTFKFAPKHQSGVLCLRQVTVAPSNLAIAIDLAFIVRLQGLLLGIRDHFAREETSPNLANLEKIPFPDIAWTNAGRSGSDSLKLYFEGLVILPSNVNLSVAPARGLTSAQAQIEGSHAAAIHAAVRKGDVRFADGGMVGVSIGKKNRTAMAVVRGVFKSILVDALLRLDGASLHFAGVSLRNHESSGQQMTAFIAAHYLASLRENMPSLLGSLAAFGNPLGLIRDIGDGVSDFVSEPVKGLKKSVEELDPVHVVDGVARGTESLARHTVGGIAGSASMLTETFSKNMAVLTLDRRYAQRRDNARRGQYEDLNFVEGVESGVAQLVRGVIEGVTGLVKAPIRGAEKNGFEGFAKGIGKGLLGLLVKPMIGLSDAATDVMIGVRGSVDSGRHSGRGVHKIPQLRPRRTMYGKDRTLRVYSLADAAASTLMNRTKLAGENYLSHVDMGDKVLLVSDKKFVLLGADGQELLLAKFKHVHSVELRQISENEKRCEWGVYITLFGRGSTDNPFVELLRCGDNYSVAALLRDQLQMGLDLVSTS